MSAAATATVLAFDFGLGKLGVAVGNPVTGTAQALTTLPARDGTPRWREIQALLAEWRPGLLLVGLPLHMDGGEGELARRARQFGRRLEGRCRLPVAFMDERLSSFEARARLREAGLRGARGEARTDGLAAELILQSWLDQRR